MAGGFQLGVGDIQQSDVIGTDYQAGQVQDAAIRATKDNNLVIDLSLGPNNGAGVPAPFDADGLQWDLQPFNVSVPIGKAFGDIVPGWGTGKLVAATIGLVVNTDNSTGGVTFTLAGNSLKDVTENVTADGHLDFASPSNATGEHYVVFAYYLIHTQYREQRSPLDVISGQGVHQSPVTSYVQNGSWVVDHFSARGAEQIQQFWNEYLLNGSDTAELLAEVGRYLWEDSQEFPSNILWTPSVPEVFYQQHGYSVAKYLPILLHNNGGGVVVQNPPPDPPNFITDEMDEGMKYVADFRQTVRVPTAFATMTILTTCR